MSYFTTPEAIQRLRIGLSKDDGNKPRLGCTEPTKAYGETPGIETFEAGVACGDIQDIPEVEWPERLEALERSRNTLFDRIDADWARALTQGRCGYCWAYSVICAMMAAMARDGQPFSHLAAAMVAARIKRGADQGGWPNDAAEFIAAGNGVCLESEWNDCKCGGMGCGGPRSGCRARDLSQVESVKASAELTDVKFYEVSSDPGQWIVALLQGLPGAGGWTGGRAWASGHAMGVLHPMRDSKRGWLPVPENSWGMHKRRIPVERWPNGGVIVVRARRKAA